MKIHPVEAKLINADIWGDWQTEMKKLIGTFCDYAKYT
jgi:hypothetical protein